MASIIQNIQNIFGRNDMKTSLNACPVCGNNLTITRYYCSQCDTTIEGRFTGAEGVFSQLTPDQLNFVLTFIRCEGRLNRMEDEMNLSYPTLRNRLVEIIRVLGFEPGKEEPSPKLTPEDRTRILDDMDSGKINYQEAKKLLQGLSGDK
jgi:hypothetical protein